MDLWPGFLFQLVPTRVLLQEILRFKRIPALLNDPKLKGRLLGEINKLDQDEPARIAKDQEIKVLNEMNELQDFENDNWSKAKV
jgi:hypothetical protein